MPPMPMIPSNRPSSYRRLTTTGAPAAIALMASPRSCRSRMSARGVPPASATSSASTSTGNRSVVPSVPVLTAITSTPRSSIRSRRKAYSAPFVSKAPIIATVFAIAMSSFPMEGTALSGSPR